ncbi:MAG: sulfur carrier protein ThiS [Pseudomonadota bacterium]
MQIQINGEARTVTDGISLEALVLSLGPDPRGIAIERNQEIVPKSEHATTMLEEGDKLEVVQFVGGG